MSATAAGASPDNPLTRYVLRALIGFVLIAASILAVYHGWNKGSNTFLATALVLALIAVVGFEFMAWKNAAVSWFERRLGAVVVWAVLGVICSGGTLYVNFSTAAGNNDGKAVIQRAAHTGYTDRTHAKKEAEDKLAFLTKRRTYLEQARDWAPKGVNERQVRSVEAAEADIARVKGHRFWTYTEECTSTKGPQSRAFCAEYAAAVMERSMAAELIQIRNQIAATEKGLANARAALADNATVISEDAANIVALASWLNTDLRTAQQADSMIITLLIQAMLVLGGIVVANEEYRHRVLRPWIDWIGIARWYRNIKLALNGQLPAAVSAGEQEPVSEVGGNGPSIVSTAPAPLHPGASPQASVPIVNNYRVGGHIPIRSSVHNGYLMKEVIPQGAGG